MHKVYSVTDRLSVQQDVIFISVEFYEFLFSKKSRRIMTYPNFRKLLFLRIQIDDEFSPHLGVEKLLREFSQHWQDCS